MCMLTPTRKVKTSKIHHKAISMGRVAKHHTQDLCGTNKRQHIISILISMHSLYISCHGTQMIRKNVPQMIKL